MSSSATDPTARYSALCPHTHLFRGGRLRIRELPDPAGYAAAPRPLDLVLRMSDGTAVDAELLFSATGDAMLAVTAHTTAAGTALPERNWSVREFRTAPASSSNDVELVVGARLD
ncbi:hypothetical protein [Streptomyces sp. NBRC 109706]|uniref:hypothetical protein n=1 Tax=Streptomyces sp. NBRC 109706 TaxID=1550035 RepID=UPI000786004D|nr:hypothetical protein [Streptomyces sp. NBRC 109706]